MSTYSAVTDKFMGINRLEKINDGEFKSCINVLSDQYPALDCGLGCESVERFDRKILKAFPNFNYGEDYIGFEGIFEDGSLEYYYYSSDYTLKKNSVLMGTNTEVFRIGHDYYNIRDYKRTNSAGIYADNPGSALTYITGTNRVFEGEITSSDDASQIIFSATQYIGITVNPGDVLAFHVSDEYVQKDSSAKVLDTFTYSLNNVCMYTVIEATTTYIKCTAVTYNGDIYKMGTEYSFISTDKCYISKKYPEFSWLCPHINRAVGLTVDGSMIMLSKPGVYNSFYDYSGESTDSYSVEVADEGKFCGCISYDSTLIVFKNNCMYGLYGDIPENFQLLKISSDIGCVDPYSISECNGSLYFLAHNGFYKYSGAKPVCISRRLGKKFESAKCCSDGKRYYALAEDKNGEKELFYYDTDFDIWYSLSYMPNDIFCQNNSLYMVYDYEITRLVSDINGEWFLESGNISDNLFYDRAVTEIYLRVRIIDEDTFINSYTAVDDKEFKPHITVSGKGFHEFYIPVRFEEGKCFRYKLEGNGKCIITDIKRIYSTVE